MGYMDDRDNCWVLIIQGIDHRFGSIILSFQDVISMDYLDMDIY
jgi:hypothetical protein